MSELGVLAGTGAGAGLFIWFFVWLIKFLFKDEMTRKERWIVFILMYIPIIVLLFHVTLTDGSGVNGKGKQDPKIQQELLKKPNIKTNLIINSLRFFISPVAARQKISPIITEEFCGVTPNEYVIYQSFNDNKPYYINPGNTSLRIVLLNLGYDNNTASLQINDDGKPIANKPLLPKLITPTTPYEFTYKECRFRISYVGYDSFFIWYLLRSRYFIKIKLEKI